MRANTLMKLGSLALDVAQDQKVRELATMIHKGARRRGLFSPQLGSLPGGTVPAPSTQATVPLTASQRIPFAPTAASALQPPMPNIQKWLTADNAKKALSWAGMVKDVLMK